MNISRISVSYNYVYGVSGLTEPPHHFVNRCYPFIVVVYVKKGTYFVRINNESYEIHEGEAMVVPEFVPHEVWMTDYGVLNWAHISAHIFGRDILSVFQLPVVYRGEDAAILGQVAQELAELSGLKQSDELLPGGRMPAPARMEQSDADVFSKANIAPMLDLDFPAALQLRVAYDGRVAYMLRVILSQAQGSALIAEENYRWISDVSQYIRNHIRAKITLEQLAAEFQMSVRKFSAEFRKHFLKSPIDYVIDERIKYSAWLLLNGANVKTVAIELSFTDSYYYTRQFKKRMGCSPTQYKAGYRNQYPQP